MMTRSGTKGMNQPSLQRQSNEQASGGFRRSGGSNGDQKKSSEDWARIWFAKLARFHNIKNREQWEFTAEEVIAFLRARLAAGTPAWKRLMIVKSLITYRNRFLRSATPKLEFIRSKLEQISAEEKSRKGGPSIEEQVGKIDPREPDVIQEFRRTLRGMGRSYNTELAYVKCVRKFMKARQLHCLADFASIESGDVESYLTDMAVDGNIAANTQEQAYYGLLFLFENVLKKDIRGINAMRSDKPKLVPTVLSPNEVSKLFDSMQGTYLLVAELLYGCGIRISECLRLRVMDIDFERMRIRVHDSKGNKSRMVPLPRKLVPKLERLLKWRAALHEQDLSDGMASVWLPFAISRKYPSAHRQFKWQFLFASQRFSRNPITGRLHRHHIHRDTFSANLRKAVDKAEIYKPVTAHVFRHSFATHLLLAGTDIQTVQELLGHDDVRTTMIYLHCLDQKKDPVVSPLDRLAEACPGSGLEGERSDADSESVIEMYGRSVGDLVVC